MCYLQFEYLKKDKRRIYLHSIKSGVHRKYRSWLEINFSFTCRELTSNETNQIIYTCKARLSTDVNNQYIYLDFFLNTFSMCFTGLNS